MVRKMMFGFVVLGLVAFIGACSDDDVVPDTGMPDQAVDMPVADAGVDMAPTETAPDMAPTETAPDASPKYALLVGAAEFLGKATPDGGMVRLGTFLTNVERPDPVIKPDFIDAPKPPNCYAYTWKKTGFKNRNAWEAGKLSITGHDKTATYMDGNNPAAPVALPETIECTRKQVTGSTTLWQYSCGLPEKMVLPDKSMFPATGTLTMSSTGGADVPAWSVAGVTVAEAPVVSTDLTTLDPTAGVEIKWDATVKAGLVLAWLKTQKADGSEFADVVCTGLAGAGSKKFPAAALALIPKGSPTNPTVIQALVVGLNPGGKTDTWGSVTVAAGKGVFGVTYLVK